MEYRAQPEAMRSTVGNVGGIIVQGINVVSDLERTVIAPLSFAALGDAVASANASMQGYQVTALRKLLTLLQQVNDLVRRSADEYDAADRAVAGAYSGNGGGLMAKIWGTPHQASELATAAIKDSAGAAGEPDSVGNVLRYLGDAGLGQLGEYPVAAARFHGVTDFNDWLGGNADNQARIGVIEVYAGTARGFGDVPGGVHSGDVVVVEPSLFTGGRPFIGVAGDGGLFYNHGLVDPGIRGLANVSVYRPAS
ncbi:WXG100 family type VII secretion target [Amycolatopsis sp. NPDC059657]|uniref:WXG100 family type VII secretion target n=1 Tax=Amycolatopsis sp. NPDC059657 TaxID=3346899 RepID=UPI00366B5848